MLHSRAGCLNPAAAHHSINVSSLIARRSSSRVLAWRPCNVRRHRQQQLTVCRYDRRKSANNVADRQQHAAGRSNNRNSRESSGDGPLLDQQQFALANETIVADRARVLRACTQHRLSLELCLFIFTEQPQLLSLNTKQMAGRILSHAEALDLLPADVADTLTRCPALLDVLPLRLRSAVDALCSALQPHLTKPQALFMLASDLNLLDTPPLRVLQYLEGLSQGLAVPLQAVTQLAWQCPALLRVEAAALQVRWHSLQALLRITNPAALQQLLVQEPRLLMVSSKDLAQNHAAILKTLNITAATLNRWVWGAPMLLMLPAGQLQKRLGRLGAVLAAEGAELVNMLAADSSMLAAGDSMLAAAAVQDEQSFSGTAASSSGSSNGSSSSSSGSSVSSGSSSGGGWVCVAQEPLQLLAYVSKDPRVLLLNPLEMAQKLHQVSRELGLGLWVAAWLVVSHPSYLAAEAGLLTKWLADVRHLTDMSLLQAKKLAACPQVFLTMGADDVLAALHSLSQTLNHQTLPFTPASVTTLAAQEPALLVQHPVATAAAVRQLHGLVQEQQLRQELVLAVPALLLQGQQLQQTYERVASLLNISGAQLAVILVKDPGFWVWLVPRHTWPCCDMLQQQQGHGQQQQGATSAAAAAAASNLAAPQLSPAASTAAATMSALVHCGLRAPEVMQAAVVLHPGLLRLNPDQALQHVAALKTLASRCGSWQQQLHEGLSPDEVGKALARVYTWHERFVFLVRVGWASSCHLGELLQLTNAQWSGQFGVQFSQWKAQQELLRQQQQQQSVRRGAAAHRQQQQLQQWQPGSMQGVSALQASAAAAASASAAAATIKQQQQQYSEQDSAAGAEVFYCSDEDEEEVELSYGLFADTQQNAAYTPADDYSSRSSGGSNGFGESLHLGQLVGGQEQLHEQQQQQQQLQRRLFAQHPQELPPPQQQLGHLQGDVYRSAIQQLAQDTQQYRTHQLQYGAAQQQQYGSGSTQTWFLANTKRRSVSKRQAATAAAQLSGLELYGTWLGCLVQPVGASVGVGGVAADAAAAAAAGGGGGAVPVEQGVDAAAAGAEGD